MYTYTQLNLTQLNLSITQVRWVSLPTLLTIQFVYCGRANVSVAMHMKDAIVVQFSSTPLQRRCRVNFREIVSLEVQIFCRSVWAGFEEIWHSLKIPVLLINAKPSYWHFGSISSPSENTLDMDFVEKEQLVSHPTLQSVYDNVREGVTLLCIGEEAKVDKFHRPIPVVIIFKLKSNSPLCNHATNAAKVSGLSLWSTIAFSEDSV